MTNVKEIFDYLGGFAPLELKMDFDNPGFLVGRSNKEVKKALISLDITDEVICEAKEKSVDLIISHHPLFFELKSVTNDTPIGRKIIELISSDMSAVCMHTNLDSAKGGVNDVLAEAIGIENPGYLSIDGYDSNGEAYGMARCGFLKGPLSMDDFLKELKITLKANGLRYVDSGRQVHKVAVLGGSGSSELQKAIETGCDTFVTADIKYNGFIDAKEAGINLIDGGHFNTENLVCEKLLEILSTEFKYIEFQISEVHCQTEKYYC